MSNLSGFVKRLRDIMRNDAGINGDAQRIEQIAWMLFLKVYDAKEQDWEFDDDNYTSIIPEACRWQNWAHDDKSGSALTGDQLLDFVNNTLFPVLKGKDIKDSEGNVIIEGIKVTAETPIKKAIVQTTFADANQYMKDGVLLRQVINVIDELDLSDYEESHAFGEIYESILKELQSAGSAGEFYTPRAVTDFMAQMIQPKIGETMADFACGTGGFITSWLKVLQKQVQNTADAKKYSESIYGIEKKQFPYMLCITNLLLHGLDIPRVFHDNTLLRDVLDYTVDDQFDVILMNPPFGGSEKAEVKNHFPSDLASNETSDLFVAVILHRIKKTGRAAILLPEGFLTGVDSAKVALKKKLLSECNLHTIVKLPNTTFAPYATVATNILFLEAGAPTEKIWFYQHKVPTGQKNYSKTKPIELSEFDQEVAWWNNREENENAWIVTMKDIVDKDYKIDFKNPRATDEEEIWDPKELISNVVENFDYIGKLWREICLDIETSHLVKQYAIKDICHIEKGKSPIQKTQPGQYPMVVTAEERLTSNEYQFDCEAVCIPLVSSTGHGHASMKRIHYQSGKFALGNILCALTSLDENIVLTKYLYVYLSHRKDDLLVPLMKGTTNVSLNMKDILNAKISIPDIDTQLEIIEKVERIKNLDIKISEARSQMEEFQKSYFATIFHGL